MSDDKQDNFEEQNDQEDQELLEGEPTVHEIVEFSVAVALDLENSMDFDNPDEGNPFETVVNLNINLGMLLYAMYLIQDLYQAVEDIPDEEMEALEAYVKAKKLTPYANNLKH